MSKRLKIIILALFCSICILVFIAKLFLYNLPKKNLISSLQDSSQITFYDDNEGNSITIELDSSDRAEFFKIINKDTLKICLKNRKDFPVFGFYTDKVNVGIISSLDNILVEKGQNTYRYKLNKESTKKLKTFIERLLSKYNKDK